MFDVQDKPKFKKRFPNQVLSNFSKNRNNRYSNPKPQKGRNYDPPKERKIIVSVVRNMRMNVLLELMVAMVVARVSIWLDIDIM